MGASIVPRRDRGRPTTSARYSRVTPRDCTISCRRRCTSGERATTISPDVSRSRRCTIPGRSGSSPPSTSYASRPCTSVPRAWPGAGWTTSPAGLSTTRRCSSSYGTARSIASGSSKLVGGAGGSNSSSSPPASFVLFGRALPSTRTPPPRSSRSAAAREPISGREARKRSRRSPAALSGTSRRVTAATAARNMLRGEERAEQDRDADDDEAVGEVEGGTVAEVEEVGDVAEPHAIQEVRRAPADHEPECDGQHRMPGARSHEEQQHPCDRDAGEDDDDGRRAREQPERDAGVLHVVDPERADDVDAVAESEVADDDVLGQLVGRDGRQADGEEPEPLDRAGAERALRHRDRRQRIRGGTDSNVLPQRLGHRRSASRLQSMHSDAHGYASSRCSAISLLQAEHVP